MHKYNHSHMASLHTSTHKQTLLDAPTHLYTHIHTHKHTCTRTHRHTHVHTQRQTLFLSFPSLLPSFFHNHFFPFSFPISANCRHPGGCFGLLALISAVQPSKNPMLFQHFWIVQPHAHSPSYVQPLSTPHPRHRCTHVHTQTTHNSSSTPLV